MSKQTFRFFIILLLTTSQAFQAEPYCNGYSRQNSDTRSSYPLKTPRVLIVTTSVPPYDHLSRKFFIDLFEYGIVCDVASTTNYLSMNRVSYDIILFSGYSNPEDPSHIKREACLDVLSGRKLIFLGSLIFIRTDEAGNKIEQDFGLKTVLGLPRECDLWSPKLSPTIEVSDGDDFLRVNQTNLTGVALNYFDELVEGGENRTNGYIKDCYSDSYFLLTNSKGAWISRGLSDLVHFGKVVAKVWWGNTEIRFGFSLNRKGGKQIFIWRVDADGGVEEEGFKWLDDISKAYRLKTSMAAIGKYLNSETAQYWRVIDENDLFEIGVHSYYHGSYETDLKWEVIETYRLLQHYGINVTKIFMGWGDSSWNSSQLESLYQCSWKIIHSSLAHSRSGRLSRYERLGVDVTSGMAAAGNLTDRVPPTLAHTSLSDYQAEIQNLNFTHENILCFQEAGTRMLPFILLTHDYSWKMKFYNDYGPLRYQIENFLSWVRAKGVKSMWLSDYHLIYFDAHEGSIIRDGNDITVIRPNSRANDIKIYVGSNNTYAIGNSILNQRIVDGSLYIGLTPEETSSLKLIELGNDEAEVASRLYEVWDKIDSSEENEFKSANAKSLAHKAMQEYKYAMTEFNHGRYADTDQYLSDALKSLDQAFKEEETYLRRLQIISDMTLPLIFTIIIAGVSTMLFIQRLKRGRSKIH